MEMDHDLTNEELEQISGGNVSGKEHPYPGFVTVPCIRCGAPVKVSGFYNDKMSICQICQKCRETGISKGRWKPVDDPDRRRRLSGR